VRDCPGFLVNRILLPYIHAFTSLVVEGVDFTFIDKCMESFGWPMGPATLMDIVGMDTGCHAAAIMGKAYPDRMDDSVRNATHVLFEAGRLGQKTGAGYYRYELDKKGKPRKVKDPAVQALIAPIVTGNGGLSEEVVIHRMMIPLCLEAVRCLEEGIADSAADIDLALVNGIGYPTYIGGALAYIDTIGVKTFVWMCDQYSTLGEAYRPTARLREMAASNQTFYAL
jgi:3-hydroxyacyl-CoA dehydrogenase / enoyl-CoA hydratase / 3-hydroxybutyryl-CoA epimerase / enoyl-CoA isomerase